MFRTTTAAVFSTLLVATSAMAADAVDSTTAVNLTPATGTTARLSQEASSTFAATSTMGTLKFDPGIAEKRPAALMSMYAGLVALQAYDVVSTSAALKSGAHEANPVMSGVVGNPVAFVAMKAGMTGVSIFAAERMWRQHHRMQAVAVMALSNGFMAYVAAHNHSVLAAAK